MTTYAEPRSDEDLLKEIGDAKRGFVVGCPVCANMNLNYHKGPKGSPIYQLKATGMKALSTSREVKRLASFLTDQGLDVGSWVPGYPGTTLCVLENGAGNKLADKSKDFDVIIAVSCESGAENIHKLMPGKRVINTMKARGLMKGTLTTKMKIAKVYLDKDSVQIKRFAFDS